MSDHVRVRRVLLVALVAAAVAVAAFQAPEPAPSPDLMTRFLARTENPLTQYVAFRRLEARNRRFKSRGWLEVRTEFDTQAGLRYTVVAEGGSSLIRHRVLRAALDAEAKLVNDGKASRVAITQANYEFAPGADAADGHSRLLITPKRKDPLLVKGEIAVAMKDADILRLEGDLSATPSWWTTHVSVVRQYTRLAGVRVPTLTTSIAQIRIVGTSDFQMTYRYEMVNGQKVGDEQPGTPVHAPEIP